MDQPTKSFLYSLLLISAILIAFGLRLYQLDAQSLWYDEGVTAVVAQYDPATLIRWTADDIQPPLYYLLVSAWGRVAGWSEWSLRFPSLFFGVLLVPLMAVLTRRLIQSTLATHIAAWITALHPLLLYYSQEARMYTMLVALGVLAGYCVVRAACSVSRREQRLAWIGYVLAAAAAVYTHYFAIFLLLALAVAYLLGRRTADGGQRMADTEGTADGRQRTADGGQQTADGRQQTADGGQRTADSGQQTAGSR
jgi:mannosyltransferase